VIREIEVLLIEDDPNDVYVALRALRRAGVESVQVAHDGAEALTLLGLEKENGAPCARPRVIFLDLQMPRMNGFELLRVLRDRTATRDIPVVVISSTQRDADVRTCYRLGANSVVVKRAEIGRPGGYFADAARYWLELNRAPEPEGGRP
jgi:CheY-like chemotaxis protein